MFVTLYILINTCVLQLIYHSESVRFVPKKFFLFQINAVLLNFQVIKDCMKMYYGF